MIQSSVNNGECYDEVEEAEAEEDLSPAMVTHDSDYSPKHAFIDKHVFTRTTSDKSDT